MWGADHHAQTVHLLSPLIKHHPTTHANHFLMSIRASSLCCKIWVPIRNMAKNVSQHVSYLHQMTTRIFSDYKRSLRSQIIPSLVKPAVSTNRTKCYPYNGRMPLIMETDGLWFWLCCKLFRFTSHSSTTHHKVMCTFLLLLLSLTRPQCWFAATGCRPPSPQQWHPSFYCSGSHHHISKYVGRNKSLLITTVKYSVLLTFTNLIAVNTNFCSKTSSSSQ